MTYSFALSLSVTLSLSVCLSPGRSLARSLSRSRFLSSFSQLSLSLAGHDCSSESDGLWITGTQFTCFTGTKVHILTQRDIGDSRLFGMLKHQPTNSATVRNENIYIYIYIYIYIAHVRWQTPYTHFACARTHTHTSSC
jgi:hypothetical protein